MPRTALDPNGFDFYGFSRCFQPALRTVVIPCLKPGSAVLLAAFLAMPALAEPAPATPAPAPAPAAPQTLWGVVDKADATVLSGPSRSAYATGTLTPGTPVEVLSIADGFAQVRSPGCCAAWIPAKQLQMAADGGSATVAEEGAACFAAGLEMKPAECATVVRRLRKGETVTVLATEGAFVRIEPPAGSSAYIQAGMLRAATAAEVAELAKAAAPAAAAATPAPAPTGAAPAPPTPAGGTRPAVAPAPPVDLKAPASSTPVKPEKREGANDPALRAAETRAKEALALSPLPAKVAKNLQAEYQALAQRKDLDNFDGQLAAGRARQFERLANLNEAREKTEAARKAGEAAAATPAAEVPPAPLAARGRILASGIYNGEQMPALFRVVDAEGLTIGYLRAEAVPTEFVGQEAEIEGQSSLDPALQVRLITPSRIIAQKVAPPPVAVPAGEAKPEAKPAPEAKPEPKPAAKEEKPAETPAPETKPAPLN